MRFKPLVYEYDRLYMLREIAGELGVTVERVRQIEKEAMLKLKIGLLAKGFTEEDIITHLRSENGSR
jgi:DNA-directed RNA polymerase sigma subunit (sigma70/sigma32)